MLKTVLFAPAVTPQPLFERVMRKCGSQIVHTASVTELFHQVTFFSPERMVVISSPALDSDTVRLAEQVRAADHSCPLLILVSSISADTAICAMRAGAWDLLEQTASEEKIVETLKSLETRHRQYEAPESSHTFLVWGERMLGSGKAMTRLRSQLSRAAATDANVMITGESGTGKELAAELIHENSRRQARPFVAVNCAAVPDTLLESELFGHERGAFTGAHAARDGKLQHATGGTLFLDEIGDMSLLAQAKILRAVDSRVIQRLGSNVDFRVQVRLISATNQDLELFVQEKKFRQDLYYRLNVVRLAMPPLRERLEDIPELVDYMVRSLSAEHKERTPRVEREVIQRLQLYPWPGNVRELRNVVESILVFSSSRSIGACDMPMHIRQVLRSFGSYCGEERSDIINALTSAGWRRSEAARILSCSRMTLYRKMAKYAIPATSTTRHPIAHVSSRKL
jgi:DNA-binding NtrC family response regulator